MVAKTACKGRRRQPYRLLSRSYSDSIQK